MQKNKAVFILFVVLVLADSIFSFLQFYHSPLYGDLASHVLPDENIQKIFDDPFGFKTLLSGEKHANPNRFFSHWALMQFFQKIPFFLQQFTNPVLSVYLGAAIGKTLIFLMFLFIISTYVLKGFFSFRLRLLVILLIIPLIQAEGFWSRMGIIDQSVAYNFFYSLPLVMLLFFLYPVFYEFKTKRKIQIIYQIALAPFIVILPLSGPLVPAIIILLVFLLVLARLFQNKFILKAALHSLPTSFIRLLLPAFLVSFYSLFLGFYNSNYDGESITLLQRFEVLPLGIWSQLIHSPGFPLMLILIAVNMIILKKNNSEEHKNLKKFLFWFGIFAVLYILFLPFGGYRPYRAKIIRYDTFMPITIAVIYFFVQTSYLSIYILQGLKQKKYVLLLTIVLLIFAISDLEGLHKNDCEKNALENMANSSEKIIEIPKDCFVLNWENKFDLKTTEKEAAIIHFWNITPEVKLFYNRTE